MIQTDIQSIRMPRNGSDYAIHVAREEGGHHIQLTAVMDTIGSTGSRASHKFARSLEKRFKKLIKEESIGDLEAFTALMRATVMELNSEVHALHKGRKPGVAGFCVLLGLLFDDQCRILWLGDCRAYLIKPPPGPESQGAPVVQCLTRDHNRLYDTLQEQGEFVFLKNEMQEMSRTLVCYWGTENAAMAAGLLEEENVVFNLQPGDLLLLLTDGGYLPVVRARLDVTNFRLTPDEFSLETWIRLFIRDREFYGRDGHCRWQEFFSQFLDYGQNYSLRRKRYRDDVAAIALYVAG